MDVALLLFLPLVGGYIFSSNFVTTKYYVSREDGHRLYFRAVFYGVIFFVVAVFLRLLLIAECPFYLRSETYVFVDIVGTLFKEGGKGPQSPQIAVSLMSLALGAS